MKTFASVGLLILVILLPGCVTMKSSMTELLPGLTYYDGPEKLTGKLIFLLQHNKPKNEFDVTINSPIAASIYEFDLQRKTLNKVTDSPNGRFIPSQDGDAFCVIYSSGQWHQHSDTNVFIYSESLGLSRTIRFDSPPGMTVVTAGHVFFELGERNHNKLVDYDIAKDRTQNIELPDVSKREIQGYEMIHAQPGQTNILHFHYTGIGKRLAEGKDYPDGIYSLDINTGNIRPFMVKPPVIDSDDESYWFKAFDGNFISFSGGNGAPFNGFKLVSTDWYYVGSDEITSDDKDKKIKILHTFFKLQATFNSAGAYHLIQTSPDLHYAWVKSGYTGTYYLVDVTTGKTRVLLKTDSSVSMVRWVRNGQ